MLPKTILPSGPRNCAVFPVCLTGSLVANLGRGTLDQDHRPCDRVAALQRKADSFPTLRSELIESLGDDPPDLLLTRPAASRGTTMYSHFCIRESSVPFQPSRLPGSVDALDSKCLSRLQA